MSYYYPRAIVELRILPEDYQLRSDPTTQQSYIVMVQPRDISIVRNDYKTTDTFSMELDYRNFPFDPRTARSIGVIIYIQDVGSNYTPQGRVNKLSPGSTNQATLDAVNYQGTNAVFAGFVDKNSIDLDESKRTVRFEGRDYTALLIDQKYQEKSPIDQGRPLDVILENLLATFKATAQIKLDTSRIKDVEVGPPSPLPILSSYDPEFGSKLAGRRNSDGHESYWDIIQSIVSAAGFICYIDLDKLVLATPRNQEPASSDDIKFIYGKNVKSLHLERKLGRLKNINIKLVSRYDKGVISAKIPEEATEEWAKQFGIERKPATIPVLKPDGSVDTTQNQPAPYLTFPIPKINDKDHLIRIGQSTYEQYSLQQLEGHLETHEMLGRGQTYDSNGNPNKSRSIYDLTQIRKGSTLCLEIDADDLSKISRLSEYSERVNYLVNRGYTNEVASVFAKTIGKFSPRFFIKSYDMKINQDTGFSLKINFLNIIDTTQISLA